MPTPEAPRPAALRTASVTTAEFLNPDVVLLHLTLDDGGAPFPYRAGQYLALHLEDGGMRCYSMARAPTSPTHPTGQSLELHVRIHPGGQFSTQAHQLASRPAQPARLLLSGPYGDCTWHPPATPTAPTLMLATGTGIAPLRALLDEALTGPDSAATRGPITLYWGGQTKADLYLADELQALEWAHPRFRFVPVMRTPVDGWQGQVGEIAALAARAFPDLHQARVYACGAPAMVLHAADLLTRACGLPSGQFHADPFGSPSLTAPSQPKGDTRIQIRITPPSGPAIQLDAPVGQSLMHTLGSAGLTLGVCGGRAACGHCRVGIAPAWQATLPPAQRAEQRLLKSFEDAAPDHRLSCQITLSRALDGLEAVIATPAL